MLDHYQRWNIIRFMLTTDTAAEDFNSAYDLVAHYFNRILLCL
jgi:hypothetical protein